MRLSVVLRFAAFWLAAAVVAQAQTFSTLATFKSSGPNALIQGSDGNFYGSYESTIFKLTPSGDLTTLVNSRGADTLLQVSDGNFYGISGQSIVKITLAGVVTVLYTFPKFQDSEDYPTPNALIQGSDGNLYGTTLQGGTSLTPATFGDGTVFMLTPDGTLTTLYNFSGPDGASPSGTLIQGSDGNFYGTTSTGGITSGSGNCTVHFDQPAGCGTVFKITPTGSLTTLHSFNGNDGNYPSVLIQASDGNFYGIADGGGQDGQVFKLTPTGSLTTLNAFEGTDGGGIGPSLLIQAADGNFYGSTAKGGSPDCPSLTPGAPAGCGTLFQLTLAGALTTLYDFPPSEDNFSPEITALLQGSNGSLYGASSTIPESEVFELTLASPNAPAIAANNGVLNGASFQPGISPGAWITISGTNFATQPASWTIVKGSLPTTTGGVSVSVGGQPAYIEYVSSTQINALAPNIPAGSVPVVVTNSNGASQSVNAQLSAETPAFFQWGNYAVATHQDYSYAVKNGTFAGLTTVAAAPGDVIILWGTGFGPTSPAAPAGMETPSTATYNTANAVSVTVGGKNATVYGAALASGYAGLYQIAIQIPAGLANGDYPVVATIDGVASPSTTLITVQQ